LWTRGRESCEINEVGHVAKAISSLDDEIEGWTSRYAGITPLSHITAVIRAICSVVPQHEHTRGIISASRLNSDECRDLIDMDN
jgi:hypothetical protein